MDFFRHILLAIVAFALTNVDDIIILSFYFAQPGYRARDIVLGQYLGVLTLVFISLSGLVLGQIFNPEWIKWLGLVPMFLGFRGLYKLWRERKQKNGDGVEIENKRGRAQFLNVALITFANGGDNIGVYTPLFANLGRGNVFIYVMVFLILIGVWCFLAHKIGRNAVVKKAIAKGGHIVLPVFLILLGGWIIWG